MVAVLTNIFRDLVPLQVENARLTLGRSGVRTSTHNWIHWTDTILNHGVYMALQRSLFFCERTIEVTDQRIVRPSLNVQIESVHKICRQNLSKIKLCDWPDTLDTTSWQVLSTTESVGWTDSN